MRSKVDVEMKKRGMKMKEKGRKEGKNETAEYLVALLRLSS